MPLSMNHAIEDIEFWKTAALEARAQRDDLVKALETAAARFNLMGGVGLVNGADPKVGYREAMDALAVVRQHQR